MKGKDDNPFPPGLLHDAWYRGYRDQKTQDFGAAYGTPNKGPESVIGYNDPITAPKDGTLLRLFVDYSGENASGSLEDAEQAWSIGFNSLDNTGEDVWQIAGWDWCQDCFTEGHGTVIGWLPFHDPATASQEGQKT